MLADVPKWHRWDRISALAPPLVMGRAGAPSGSAEAEVAWVGSVDGRPELAMLPRVSSTEIRAALAEGRLDAVRGLVPANVLEHISAGRLYGVPAPAT